MNSGSPAPESSAAEEAARPAVEADLTLIAGLAGELRAELAEQRGGPLWSAHDALPLPTPQSLDARCTDARLATIAGTLDGHVLAYGLAHLEDLPDNRSLGVIDELFVAPPARAVALGETVLGALVAWCEDHHCVAIDATALPGDRIAKNFFESAGFTARRLVMHKRLS